ncbi:MAG: hypothetical protein Q8907_01260 [Bacteroidota bacterium]|nr:hypothetical protein [Bacteroidota bacterium]MDP4272886.1 hypothetical protein [Bacteroidota bacterium]
MKYILPFLFFLIFSPNSIRSQGKADTSVMLHDSQELGFINYLINTGQYQDATYELNRVKPVGISTDSINYLKGWSYFNQKMLDSSIYYLSKVSPKAFNFNKSRFYTAYCYSYMDSLKKSRDILNNLPLSENELIEVREFELAGLSLMERDNQNFVNHSKNFTFNYYPISEQEKEFMDSEQKLINFKPKSIIVAGTLSAIIPGSGKIYAGRLGEGLSSFLMVSILGAVTAENYCKAGLKDFKTLAFGSLFTVFYIGNIYGSVFSIQVRRNNFYNAHDKKILFNLQIPLRTIFN